MSAAAKPATPEEFARTLEPLTPAEAAKVVALLSTVVTTTSTCGSAS